MNKSMYNLIENYMLECMNDSAHDSEHIYRVLYLSLNIASKRTEKINNCVLITSCLLHDIGREEQFKNNKICHAEIGGKMAYDYLVKIGWEKEEANHVKNCISSHRFRGNNIPETIEAKILFDADKLDVVGNLGIARTLLYKGTVGSNIYEVKNEKICFGNNKEDEETFLKEYNFKLKNLYNKFYTDEAREMANIQKQHAQTFYDKLVEQIMEIYKSKDLINNLLND